MAFSLKTISSELEPQLHALYQAQPEELKLSVLGAIADTGSLACGQEAILQSALADPSPTVRIRAIAALGQIGPAARPYVPKLARMLFDEPDCFEHPMRGWSRATSPIGIDLTEYLGQQGHATTCFHGAVIQVLLNLEDPPPQAVEALRTISARPDRSEQILATLRLWRLEHADPELRRLIGALGTSCPQRWKVIEALAEAGERASPAAPQLRSLLATVRPDSLLAKHIRHALAAIAPDQGAK